MALGLGALGAAVAARANSLFAEKGLTKTGWKVSATLTVTKRWPDEAPNAPKS